ncbi:MAG: bifunctional phosphopantothenoylcysteine decarboxylase/phosphopantothenate--cysteine ligase CoaBC, partial [Ignavibacteria bacterium]|nr:bifunctional phosphopantothenoylcysteine decarboxylase/phosphopantothenate--cysteine ligase CoaBC [Ignavibacteria bacterium]
MNFNKKRILLGITGSIAAYKAPLIVRDLIKSGAEVRVVATSAAKNFVSLTVLEELTHYPVISDVFDERIRGKGAWHIEISHWCDAFIIAPCTANTISKLVIGQCDTAITCIATALPANKPFIIAPAMDWTMFEAIATQNNLNTLKNRGVSVIEPASGELASGLIGKGRLPDNEIILTTIYSTINSAKKLSGINVLITAGATREAIDDVRYITNNSSGRMGFALASVAKELGASVTLISGKTEIKAPNVDKFIEVISANDMFTAVKGEYSTQDIIIMAAAVADFTPITRVSGKIKKDFAPISEISVKP